MTFYYNLLCSGSLSFAAIPTSLAWRLHLQKDDRILDIAQRNFIELKAQELATKLGINKRIEILEKSHLLGLAQAQGLAIFSTRAGIAINPQLFETLTESQTEFILAHEIAHIKANDFLTIFLIPGLIGMLTHLAISFLVPAYAVFVPLLGTSISATLGALASYLSLVFVSRWREECADKLGYSNCSLAAQIAGPGFFENAILGQQQLREQEGPWYTRLFNKVAFTEEGDFRLDFLHPPLTTRVNYLRQPLERLN